LSRSFLAGSRSGTGKSCLPPLRVSEGFIDLPGLPEAKEQHRELAGDGYHRPLLAALAASLGESQASAPEICVRTEGAEDVLSGAHQKRAQLGVAGFGDPQLR
jgi:hypothetical protein